MVESTQSGKRLSYDLANLMADNAILIGLPKLMVLNSFTNEKVSQLR